MLYRQFATAEEAALAYARVPEARMEPASSFVKARPRTDAQQTLAKPRVEGVKPEPSNNEPSGEREGARIVRSTSASCPSVTAAKRVAPPAPPPAKQPRLINPAPRQATVLWTQPWFGTCLPGMNISQTQASVWSPKYAPTFPLPPVATARPLPPPVSAAPAYGCNSFESLLAKVKWELNIAPATSAEAAIAQANALMGFSWSSGTLRQQLDRLVAETTCACS